MYTDVVEKERIFRRIDELAAIGGTEAGGVTRPAFSEDEALAIEYVLGELPDTYISSFDTVGNFYATPDPDADQTLLVGSHIDSVHNGGPLDGALGVIVALEAIDVAASLSDGCPVPPTLTIFRGEESARFGRGTIGSRAATGKLPGEDFGAEDRNGVSLREAVSNAGFELPTPGTLLLDSSEVHAYLETHIEQGPVLETAGTRLGIVTSIRAPVRYSIEVTGEYDHSGATPMNTRRDAIAGASDIVAAVESLGRKGAKEGNLVATVTEFDAHDTASNKICGRVSLTIDLRSIDEEFRDHIEQQLVEVIDAIAADRELTVTAEPYYRQEPVPLADWVIDSLEEHAEAIHTSHQRLPSGGGHDGRHLQSVGIPSGMLFVPSINGVSHSPGEKTVEDAVVDAAAVFARAIVEGL